MVETNKVRKNIEGKSSEIAKTNWKESLDWN